MRFGEKVNALLADSPRHAPRFDRRRVVQGADVRETAAPAVAKRDGPVPRGLPPRGGQAWLATQDAVYATDSAAIRRLRDEFKVRDLSMDRALIRPGEI